MKNQKMTVNRKILLKLLSVAFPHTVQKKNCLSLNFMLPVKLKSSLILLLIQLIVIYISNGVKIKKFLMMYLGLPTLDDVILVEDLMANLISISQLCD